MPYRWTSDPVLAGVMQRLGEEAAEAADAHIEAMRAEFETTTRTLVTARDAAEQTRRDMQLEYTAREGQIRDAKETIRSLQSMLKEERGRWEQTRSALETRCTQAQAAEQQARDEVAEEKAQQAALAARLSDAQRVIDSLITRVGEPPESA